MARDELEFRDMSDAEFWEYVVATGTPEVLIGLKTPGKGRGVVRGRPTIDGPQRQAAKRAILAPAGVEFVSEDDRLPLVRVRLSDVEALARVRHLPFVDYAEPAIILPPEGIEGIWAESVLCGRKTYDRPFDPYTTPQGDLISKVYGPDIVRAWTRSTGEGVTVGVVGTGVSFRQPQLINDFGNGQSGGRTLVKDATDPRGIPFPWHDECGHETKLIGYIAAPLDGLGVAGVAYRSSVYSVRVDDDTNLGNDSEDVRIGIARAARDHDIVAMAFGTTQTRESIKAEIQYWHDPGPHHPDGRPPLFVAAAGTGYLTKYVLFPGKMLEVVTVTGTELNGDACSTCHRGEEVEFASFAHEPVLDPDGGYDNYLMGGGSSQSVATLSAMASLVWSRYPSYTADQVVARLRAATPRSFLGYGKDPRTGWGAPKISCAVGGICGVNMGGPDTIFESGGTFTFQASQYVNNVPASYKWTIDKHDASGVQIIGPDSQSGLQISVNQISSEQYFTINLEATELFNGAKEIDSRSFIVRANGQSCGTQITC